ncbi:MAG: polymerase, sigma-24 subunit, subfamily [Marmoricola sp.]|nr:polymerase, sigma-24 subunit, subfamily [Marmoricola sp.]
MTDPEAAGLTPDPDPSTDAELITRVRAGDTAAYEQLFLRHREMALRYARRIANPDRAEDLCAEAFTKVLDVLLRGKGPDVAFRAYLFTTIRTSHLNAIRAAGREDLVPDHDSIPKALAVLEDSDDRYDRTAIYRAYASLPERWRAALWLTAVEGLGSEEASERLGIKVNAVASLAFRARAGLRRAYLAQHLLDAADPECQRTLELLPSHLRSTITARRRSQVQEHLDRCTSCSLAAVELNAVDSGLGALLVPLGIGLAGLGGSGVAGLAVVAGSGAATGAASGAATTTTASTWSSALPALLGSKVAIAATVTVLSAAAVSTQLVSLPHHHQPSVTVPAASGTGASTTPDVSSPPGVPPTSAPSEGPLPGATPSSGTVVVSAPGDPAAPSSASSDDTDSGNQPGNQPSPTPTETPDQDPTPSADPSPTARALAVGQVQDRPHTKNGIRWDGVTVPVANAAPGTTLVIRTTRTIQAARPSTVDTGWTCTKPLLFLVDGTLYGKSRTTCTYQGPGTLPVALDFQVATGSTLSAVLTAPPGYDDTSPDDNTAAIDLRH